MRHPDDGTLMAMLDGEIPSDALEPITGHLAGCADCRGRLEEMRDLVAGTDAMMDDLAVGAPEPAWPSRTPAVPRPSRLPLYRNLAWAATTLLAVGLGYWVRDSMEFGGAAGPLAMARQEPAASAAVESATTPGEVTEAAAPAADAGTAMPAAASRQTLAATPPPEAGQDREQAKTTANLSPAERQAVAQEARRESGLAAPAAPARVPFAVGRLTSGDRPVAAAAPTALADRAMEIESYAPLGFPEAIGLLGGTIRLVDGMVPARLESSGGTVRVIYLLETGELVLEQWRAGDSVAVALRGPVSADSLAVLRRRIR